MTGQKNTVVRKPYTQESEWRDALGGQEPLLLFATTGYCLDAPEHLPSGSTTYGYPMNNARQTPMGNTFAR